MASLQPRAAAVEKPPALRALLQEGPLPGAFAPAPMPAEEVRPVEGGPAPIPGDRGPAFTLPAQLKSVLSEQELRQISEVFRVIETQYVDPVSRKRLFYGALRGMAQSLDPYSRFFDPEELAKYKQERQGSYGGIGVTLNRRGDGIAFAMPGSPAERAGLRSGDRILEIDGGDIGSSKPEEVARRLRGPQDTQVSVTVSRIDEETRKPVILTVTPARATVNVPNSYAKMLCADTGYIHFESFREAGFDWGNPGGGTAAEVLEHVRGIKKAGASSLVLDLRFNGGGSLDAVTAIAAAFLKKGQTIVVMKDRQGQENRISVSEDGEFSDLDVKVLVNGYSASASEILASALQDNGRGTVIGRRTYGKGSAQSFIGFEDGSALKLTLNRWYRPNGASIDRSQDGGGGVSPDVTVKVDEETEMKAYTRILSELYGRPAGEAVPDPSLEAALK